VVQNAALSIILPTYNRGTRLQSCVQSVVDQTFRDWELIICDDASTDDTDEIAAELIQIDERIRYFKNAANQGLPANRNIGISKAKASQVLFIEDDLILEPDCVAILMETFTQLDKQHKVGAVASSRPDEWQKDDDSDKSVLDYAWRGSSRKMTVPCTFSSLTGLVHYNFVPAFTGIQEVPSVHSCSLYSREALEDVGGYDGTKYGGNYLYEEADLNIRLRKKGYKFYFQPAALMHHRLAHTGGCRASDLRYAFYFVLNHTKFVLKNFGLRSVWMVPSFLFVTGFVALRALVAYAISAVADSF
jgi:glycosyltransferase involved in cell wall biosynthesis